MERHKLWNDRAEKLMKKTFESWSKGKKKKEPVKEELKISENEERWTVEWFPATSDRRAIKKFYSGDEAMNFIKGENLLDAEDLTVYDPNGEEVDINPVQEAPRYGEDYADMDGEEPQGNDNPSQDVYAMLDNLRSKVVGTPLEGDVLAIMDKMDANPEMTDTKYPEPSMAEKLSEMSDETESPDVARAAEDAKQAKIKAVKAQLDALQKK